MAKDGTTGEIKNEGIFINKGNLRFICCILCSHNILCVDTLKEIICNFFLFIFFVGLLALGKVINALNRKNASHIPHRESVLTRALKGILIVLNKIVPIYPFKKKIIFRSTKPNRFTFWQQLDSSYLLRKGRCSEHHNYICRIAVRIESQSH